MSRRDAQLLVASLGARTLSLVERVGDVAVLAARAAWFAVTPPFRLRAIVYQVHAQGVRALGLAVAAALFVGMAMAVQFGTVLHRFGALSLLSQLTMLALVRELMPVLAGLVIGARLTAGIAAELSSMAVTEQIDAVRVLGADPVRELVMPRVVAATLVLPLVTIFGNAVGALGALAIAYLEYHIGGRFFFDALKGFITSGDFFLGVLKSIGFGWVAALLGGWHGLNARGGTEGVGRATTRAVVQAALAVIVADYFLSRALVHVLPLGM
jgi:phospholipid/cholesterol/gamma-HCH transport system permease protein